MKEIIIMVPNFLTTELFKFYVLSLIVGGFGFMIGYFFGINRKREVKK